MALRTTVFALALAGALSAGSLAARADETADGLARALELYNKADLAGALREIAFANSAIAQKLNEAYGSTLPEAPAGWTADEISVETSAVMGLGQSVSRVYSDPNGASVRLSLAADSPLLQTMGMVFSNPMLAAQAGFQRVRINGEEALIQTDKAGGTTMVMLVIAGRLLLQAEGSDGATEDAVKSLMSAWKIDDLKRLAGI